MTTSNEGVRQWTSPCPECEKLRAELAEARAQLVKANALADYVLRVGHDWPMATKLAEECRAVCPERKEPQ